MDGVVPGEAVCPLVVVGIVDGLTVGEAEGLVFGPNEIMLKANSGTTVATTIITIMMPASKPLFMPLPFCGGGGGGG